MHHSLSDKRVGLGGLGSWHLQCIPISVVNTV